MLNKVLNDWNVEYKKFFYRYLQLKNEYSYSEIGKIIK